MKRENRNVKITVRFTRNEFDTINAQFSKSVCKEMSDYFRTVLLKRKLTINCRNQSLDDLIEEFKLLRKELNAIGNNFNQVVKKLNGSQEVPDIVHWTSVAITRQKALLVKVEIIKVKIGSISDIWLQKL